MRKIILIYTVSYSDLNIQTIIFPKSLEYSDFNSEIFLGNILIPFLEVPIIS